MLYYVIPLYVMLMLVHSFFQLGNNFYAITISKMLCSVSFVAVAVVSGVSTPSVNVSWFYAMLTALLLSSLGDLLLALQHKGERGNRSFFIAGGISFFLAHIVFSLMFVTLQGIQVFPLLGSLLVFLFGAVLVLKLRARFYYFTFLMVAYGFILTLMMLNGVSFLQRADTFGILVALGSILFFISDCIIYSRLIVKFLDKDVDNKIKNLGKIGNTFTYFPAQLLLALSILFC